MQKMELKQPAKTVIRAMHAHRLLDADAPRRPLADALALVRGLLVASIAVSSCLQVLNATIMSTFRVDPMAETHSPRSSSLSAPNRYLGKGKLLSKEIFDKF